MAKTSKDNPIIIENLISELKLHSKTVKELLIKLNEDQTALANALRLINHSIENNQPINARKINEYLLPVNEAFLALIEEHSLTQFQSKLEQANKQLDELNQYFTQHYQQTVDREKHRL
jgi:hypothetical protein